jgi:hypothetical protein
MYVEVNQRYGSTKSARIAALSDLTSYQDGHHFCWKSRVSRQGPTAVPMA